jgi:hypothetical protein
MLMLSGLLKLFEILPGNDYWLYLEHFFCLDTFLIFVWQFRNLKWTFPKKVGNNKPQSILGPFENIGLVSYLLENFWKKIVGNLNDNLLFRLSNTPAWSVLMYIFNFTSQDCL